MLRAIRHMAQWLTERRKAVMACVDSPQTLAEAQLANAYRQLRHAPLTAIPVYLVLRFPVPVTPDVRRERERIELRRMNLDQLERIEGDIGAVENATGPASARLQYNIGDLVVTLPALRDLIVRKKWGAELVFIKAELDEVPLESEKWRGRDYLRMENAATAIMRHHAHLLNEEEGHILLRHYWDMRKLINAMREIWRSGHRKQVPYEREVLHDVITDLRRIVDRAYTVLMVTENTAPHLPPVRGAVVRNGPLPAEIACLARSPTGP